MSSRIIQSVTGPAGSEVLGTSSELQPADATRQFVENHFELAWKLHHTAGVQQFRNGVKQFGIGFDKTDRDNPQLDTLREADELLDISFAKLSADKLSEVSRKTVIWCEGFPPQGSDFSVEELAVLGKYEMSPLVQLYLEYMPVVSVDVKP